MGQDFLFILSYLLMHNSGRHVLKPVVTVAVFLEVVGQFLPQERSLHLPVRDSRLLRDAARQKGPPLAGWTGELGMKSRHCRCLGHEFRPHQVQGRSPQGLVNADIALLPRGCRVPWAASCWRSVGGVQDAGHGTVRAFDGVVLWVGS